MGLLRWLMGPRGRGVVVGDSAFCFRVVGTSFHQEFSREDSGRSVATRLRAVLCRRPSAPALQPL